MDRRKFLAALTYGGLSLGAGAVPFQAATRKRSAANAATKYSELITPAQLRARLSLLASDLYEGRETGSRGQHLAALYLGSEHLAMGNATSSLTYVDAAIVLKPDLAAAYYFRWQAE